MKKVISASRRTDIPAFYLKWFFESMEAGSFKLTNPYNGRVRTVEVSRESVAGIVFWSKNYGPLLKLRKRLSGWNAVFNFTLNSVDSLIEPSLPPLERRLEQMRQLATEFGSGAVRWRFDPVVFYRRNGRLHDNLQAFESLLEFAAGVGLTDCTISFMDYYRKIERRQKAIAGFEFIYPDGELMFDTASSMAAKASEYGIRLVTCCEPLLADRGIGNLEAAACIDHGLLEQLYGQPLSHRKDRGQRSGSGCLCHESIDIGSYREHPCYCDCLYCYANPVSDTRGKKS
jgi:hypothetical protein